jgi:regulator of cell morphogenesis and NO signaling
MTGQPYENATVGDIVAADFRAAAIFEGFGIDFCCGGRRSLADACRTASADPVDVIRALQGLPAPSTENDDAAGWRLDRLIDHIVATHHTYVREAMPAIMRRLIKLADAHGERHPELHRILDVFHELNAEMTQHMLKEERVLFPYIRDLATRDADRHTCLQGRNPFGTVDNPIRMMEREHREAADALMLIRELTGGYTTPEDGCATYKACMEEFDRFERDLHRHVHLENNVLFPRARALEDAATGVAY